MNPIRGIALTLCAAAGLTACQTAYYGTMEKFGVHKRDILVDRIEDARDDQEEAKEQFLTALERFTEVTGFQGGDLQEVYNKLNRELERSENRAKDVRKSIAGVEDVAHALFKEWQQELELYGSTNLRQESARKLRETQDRYAQLVGAMRRAESRMDPVLVMFRDQVLYLKHNLNAQAIASLQNELAAIRGDVARLIREMEASIAEANAFIEQMSSA